MKQKILLIEDTLEIKLSIEKALQKQGYTVFAFDSAETVLPLIKQKALEIDLLLLDLMLPGMNGAEFLEVFQQYYTSPVLVISALSNEDTQTKMYKSKVDDYVIKPFSINILLLKIEAVLRRTEVDHQQVLNYQDISISLNNYYATYKGNELELTAKEFELLQSMLTNLGKVFTRQELVEAIWGYDFIGDSRTVDVHIKNIRKKTYPELIKTIKGVGYKIAK